ncbi:uncharacterized protein LOC124545070 isoform X1 [Schistocerca americana]|uniref:uncharacterized protein LOC124545070 isoform X1 n=1 Tax=Schistocerca americana TaxID=7009 RepID=UPI001F4F8C0E|nr:uncharacterized protein LOC124545070 isoform X1 [Schistocerca americana]
MSHLPERRKKSKNSGIGRRNSNALSGSSSSYEKESSENDGPVPVSLHSGHRSSDKGTIPDTKGETTGSKFSSYFPLTSGEPVKEVLGSQDTQEVLLTSSDGGVGRVPSPSSASSVASARRLEWDSGADVGYNLHYTDDTRNDEKRLSTIERLALAQGHLAVFPERSEPEGKSGPTAVINTTTPGTSVKSTASRTAAAHSTPIDTSQIRSATLCTTKSENDITPIIRLDNKVLLQNVNQSCSHSDASVQENKSEGRKMEMSEVKETVQTTLEKEDNRCAENCNLERTGSCSLVDLRPNQFSDEKVSPNLHRSQSDINLLLKPSDCNTQKPEVQFGIHNPHANNLAMAAAHSASSSSIATIVNNRLPQRKPDSLKNLGKVSVSVQTDHNALSHSGSSSQASDTPVSSRSCKERLMASNNVDRVLIGAESIEFVKGKQYVDDKTVSNFGIQTELSSSIVQVQREGRKYEDDKCSHCPGRTCKGAHKKVHGQQRPDTDTLVKERDRNPCLGGVIQTVQSEASRCATNGAEQSHETTVSASNINQAISSGMTIEVSGAVDSANSFEYVPGEIYQRHINNGADTVKNFSPGEERPHSAPSDVTSACTKSDVTDSGEVQASGASTLARDLEKSVQMLQKLVENHKSDAALRKKLVRSVVDKLVSSNYDDDQDDDCERPSKQEVLRQKSDMIYMGNVQEQFQRSSRSVGVGCSSKSLSSSNQSTQSQSQTPSTSRCVRQGRSTLKKVHPMVSLSTTSGSVSLPVPADSCTDATPGDEYYSSSLTNSSASNRNRMHWRQMKTVSEQEFDKQHSKSDESALKSQLLKFCETERGNQLSWIQFEIEHLSNLKQFLMGQKSLTRSLESLYENRQKLPTSQFTKCASATQTSFRTGDHEAPSRSSSQDITGAENADKPKCHVHSKNVPNKLAREELNGGGFSKPVSVNQGVRPYSQQRGAGILTEKQHIRTKHVDLVIDMKLKSGDRTLVSRTEKLELPGSCSGDFVSLETPSQKTPVTDESGSVERGRINVFVQTQKQAKTANQMHDISSDFKKLNHKENIQFVESNRRQNRVERTPMCCCECKRELDLIAKAVKSAKENHFSKHKAAAESGISKKECTQCENSYRNYKVEKGRVINKDGSSQSTVGSSSPVISDNSSHAVFYQGVGQLGMVSGGTDTADNLSFASAKPVFSASRSTNVRRKHLNMNGSKKPLKIDKGEQVNGHSLGAPATSDISVQVTSDSILSGYKNAAGNGSGGSGDHVVVCDNETSESKQRKNAHCDREKKLDDCQMPVEITGFGQKRQMCPCCKKSVSEESVYALSQQFLVNSSQQKACPCCYVLQKYSQKSEREIESQKTVHLVSEDVHSNNSNQNNSDKTDEINNNTQKENEEHFDIDEVSNSPDGDCKPLAYILAFEPAAPNAAKREEEMRRKSLEVIKVKVPSLRPPKKGEITTTGNHWGNIQKGKEGSNPINDEKLGHSASFRDRGATEQKIYKTTLQELLRSRRPDYVQNAEERRHCVAEMTRLREQRLQECRNLLAAGLAPPPPPPPSSVASEVLVNRRRVFTQKQMKSLTKRHYRLLPETQNKNSERKRKQDFRTNRLMAEIFARKLQRRVLKGEVNLSNSVTVISSSA